MRSDRKLRENGDFQVQIFGKTSGGCSLDESPNDKGFCHVIIHSGYRAPKFKYDKEWADPPGEIWAGVKKFMKDTMAKGDFDSLWKVSAPLLPFPSQ
jgi:hypothetical protein